MRQVFTFATARLLNWMIWMVIGLSWVQYSLWSYEWLTKPDYREEGVRFVNHEYHYRLRAHSFGNNWNNASKRLFGSYCYSAIPGFPFRLFCSQEQNSRNIFRNIFLFRNIPNERTLNWMTRCPVTNESKNYNFSQKIHLKNIELLQILRLHVTSSFYKIQTYRATKVIIFHQAWEGVKLYLFTIF